MERRSYRMISLEVLKAGTFLKDVTSIIEAHFCTIPPGESGNQWY